MPQIGLVKLFTRWSDFDADNGTVYGTSWTIVQDQLAKIFVRGFLNPMVDLLLIISLSLAA